MFKEIKTGIQLLKIWKILKHVNMEKLKVYLVKNWKTAAASLMMAVIGILIKAEVITAADAALITTVAGAFGFAVAKDADKTGS